MTFNSYIFVLAFLPICVLGYYILNYLKAYRMGLVFVIGMSLWFYGYFNWKYLVVIILSVILNYIFYKVLLVTKLNQRKKENIPQNELRKINVSKCILIIAIIFNVGLLCYFKYTDFFIENINILFRQNIGTRNIMLPLGISFFTFQQLSFIVDVYKDGENINYSFIEYTAYITYFPQLVAGPIVTHDILVPQLIDISKKRLNYDSLSKGIMLFAMGLTKKVIIADTLGKFVNMGYDDVNALNTTSAFFVMLCYTFQIYFDFSGYSDMAIGLGWMMNIDLPVNFDSPYKALTVTEFWKKWHITLTSFFTKYVYIPLGGNRKGTGRTYINIFIVFLLSGLWHGAGWNFIIWGIMHGTAQIVERLIKKQWDRFHPVFSWFLSFGFINVAWVLFRANSISDAYVLLSKLISTNYGGISWQMLDTFALPEFKLIMGKIAGGFIQKYPYIYFVIFLVVIIVILLGCPNAKSFVEKHSNKRWASVVTAVILVWCIFSFSGVSTFLYFNF